MPGNNIEFRLVDAFTTREFQGNPAAVVLGGDQLSSDQMGTIAREFNLSGTVFVLPAQAGQPGDLRLRWFTPNCEIRMCAHATVAAIHVLNEEGFLPSRGTGPQGELLIQTQGGTLTAQVEPPPDDGPAGGGPVVWLDLIRPELRAESPEPQVWGSLLGARTDAFSTAPIPVRTQDGDLIVFLNHLTVLNDLRPDFGRLAESCRRWGIRGVCAATTSTVTPAVNVQSRFFAPGCGINEDPVTGSVHGPLAVHLVKSGVVAMHGDEGLAAVMCVQTAATGRSGVVRALVEQQGPDHYEVRVGGQCVTMAAGTLHVQGRRGASAAFLAGS